MGTINSHFPYSRFESFIPQDLQGAVQCVPIFVCLKAL